MLPTAPPASSDAVRARMRTTPRRDTQPELAVRRALHRRGLRYRIDVRPLPYLRRRADVVFTAAKVAVFVDGCFWHGCDQHWSAPSSNGEWWERKISLNRVRDDDTDSVLLSAGWALVRAWEHEDAETVAARVAKLVLARRPSLRSRDRGRR